MQKNCHWHFLETAEQVAQAVYQHILEAAEQAIKERGKFKLVLAGGSTPEQVYRLLAEAVANWSEWYIYYGDERCLPEDHQDRNSLMASRVLLDKVAIPASHIFTIPAELGPEKPPKITGKLLPRHCPLIWCCWAWVKTVIRQVYFRVISITWMSWRTLYIIHLSLRLNAFPSARRR
jgi:hypothetical protein